MIFCGNLLFGKIVRRDGGSHTEFYWRGKKFALKQIAASITIKQNYIYLTRNKFPKLELVIAFQVIPKKERWLCLLSGININILYVISLININYLIFKLFL